MKTPEAQFVRQPMLLVFSSVAPQEVLVRLSSPLPPFPGDLVAALKVGEAVSPAAEGWAGVWDLDPSVCKSMCFQLSTCGGSVTKLGVRFLLFFSVYCGLCSKWDANGIYSAWRGAGRGTRPSQGHADTAGRGHVGAACSCGGEGTVGVAQSDTGE